MAHEVRYDKSHHAGATAEERIRNRLRPSNAHGKTTETHPTRTHQTTHYGQNGAMGGPLGGGPLYSGDQLIEKGK